MNQPPDNIRPEDIVVTRSMLDVGYDILDEYLSYNNGLVSRTILEEAFRAMCICWLRELHVVPDDSGATANK